jgi:environmental stress-induced protein Ves
VVERIAAASYRRMPWKNGGGITHEIAVGDGWRLSVATIDRDGPFSEFAGWDRTIVPIQGNGIELDVGRKTVRLDRLFVPLGFPGEAGTSCRLADGPARDFNVMTQRDRWSHTVNTETPTDGVLDVGDVPLAFAYVLQGRLLEAMPGDTLRIDGGGRVAVAAEPRALACVVRLTPVSAAPSTA